MLEAVKTEQMVNLADAKYKVGDKVYYLDMQGIEAVGTIADITHTEIYPWNDKIVPLYLISGYQYLRTEEEIVELYDADFQ